MDDLQAIVDAQPFFAGLTPAQRATIGGCASTAEFPAGRYLFHAGSPADSLYLLRSGRVALEVSAPGRGRMAFQTIDPGELVGLSWLVAPYAWHFDAKALAPVTAVAIDARCLRAKCAADHDLGFALMERFTPVLLARLHAARVQLLDVYGGNA